MIRRRLIHNNRRWKSITEEFMVRTQANRYKMSPVLPMNGDWTEMVLTVEVISGDISALYGERLNYTSELSQYIPGGNISSPISYSAIKDGDAITITRMLGTSGVQGSYGFGSTINRTVSNANLGLWVHWAAPASELKVRGTIKYK